MIVPVTRLFTASVLLSAVSTAIADHHEALSTDSGAERDIAWVVLFDGTSLDAWRGYQKEDLPDGWSIDGDALKFSGSGGDLTSREQFGDFDLRFQWKVSPGANSGVMYLVSEDQPQPYLTGPEYQLLDNTKHHDGRDKLTSAAALYGLYPATVDPKPVGEWNQARIRHKNGRVKHWLNGELVADAKIGGDDWDHRVAGSKFAAWDRFAKNRRGHIVLQDHGDVVWYRNVRIRPLD